MIKILDSRHHKQVAVTVRGKDGKPEAKLVTADCLAIGAITVTLLGRAPQVLVTTIQTDANGFAVAGSRNWRFAAPEELKVLGGDVAALVKAIEALMMKTSEMHLESAEAAAVKPVETVTAPTKGG